LTQERKPVNCGFRGQAQIAYQISYEGSLAERFITTSADDERSTEND